ncbi:MAG: FAD-dependent oxidoreductase, partial [Coriobacteriales bacterium]
MIKFREALRLFRRLNAMKNVIVVGAGAAGLMAAYAAAKNGNAVTVLERNEKAGKKIYITGKGRCNVTNNV